MMPRVCITRDSSDEKPKRRVWITGPHFGDVFSSTEDPAKASDFSPDDAVALVQRKWKGSNPLIEGRKS